MAASASSSSSMSINVLVTRTSWIYGIQVSISSLWRRTPGGRRATQLKAPNAFEKANLSWVIELQVASAAGLVPSAHCLSRVADHIDRQRRPLDLAKQVSWVALSTLKISDETSLTPIMGVTATVFQAAASERPSTHLTCACVAVAACSA